MNEFSIDQNYSKGDSGPYVWIIQEWLCLNGISIVIDGLFGSATDAAVKKFQGRNSLVPDGVVGETTYSRLIRPLKNALEPVSLNEKSLAATVDAFARQHLKQHPHEIGDKNMGPWIRFYMKGNQGPEFQWSTGFVNSILELASAQLGLRPPVEASDTCSGLANNAKKKGLFLSERTVLADRNKVKPGYIFLNREFPGHWTHTGIVISVDEEVFGSIEGNTNDYGRAQGNDVCERIRAYDGKDFIIV